MFHTDDPALAALAPRTPRWAERVRDLPALARGDGFRFGAPLLAFTLLRAALFTSLVTP